MIKNIIFDLGNVLVKVDFEKFVRGMSSEGIRGEELRKIFNPEHFRVYVETGKTTAENHYRSISKKLGNGITLERFVFHFNSMFSEIPQMKKLLTRLNRVKKYRLILLSNTSAVHFNYVKNNFKYVNLFDKIALSYKLKLLKPDIRIYKKVLKLYNMNPLETVFIDDLHENCAAALKTGMHAIQYKGYRDSLVRLSEYGVRT